MSWQQAVAWKIMMEHEFCVNPCHSRGLINTMVRIQGHLVLIGKYPISSSVSHLNSFKCLESVTEYMIFQLAGFHVDWLSSFISFLRMVKPGYQNQVLLRKRCRRKMPPSWSPVLHPKSSTNQRLAQSEAGFRVASVVRSLVIGQQWIDIYWLTQIDVVSSVPYATNDTSVNMISTCTFDFPTLRTRNCLKVTGLKIQCTQLVAGLCVQTVAKASDTQKSLQRHIREAHSEMKHHRCEVCGKRFARSDVLHQHINTVHKEQAKLACEQCGLQFENRRGLTTHHKMAHTSGN